MRGMSYKQKLTRKAAFGAGLFCLFLPAAALAGAYLLSAHGSGTVGVERAVMASAGYGRGNCAHCHEMHASLAGDEPAPAGGAASPYALFAGSLDPAVKPYTESSNFCFYCHNSTGSAQQVTNRDYSATFGGGGLASGPQSIMAAFNQASYHNLGDIKTFVNNSSAYLWFSDSSNPCDGCHNPHLAKRNWVSIPENSAISKPSSHFSLWGEASPQLMSSYSYEAPYLTWQSTYVSAYREPDGGSTTDGSKTPDYVGFCTDCHSSTNTIWSTTLNRNLRVINWAVGGEKHGGLARDNSPANFRQPYLTAAGSKGNFVFSCLDCHEPHGSSNIMLLRRRVNGAELSGAIGNVNALGPLCSRCHTGGMESIHHTVANAPYPNPVQCAGCHGGQPSSNPVPCGNCHFHGSNDSWLLTKGRTPTYRKTF